MVRRVAAAQACDGTGRVQWDYRNNKYKPLYPTASGGMEPEGIVR